MFKLIALFALAVLCASQKSSLEHDAGTISISEPAPVEYAQSGGIVEDIVEEKLEKVVDSETELIEIPAPEVDLAPKEIHLAKETPEIVDIPHVPLNLPGNKIENTDLNIDVPSPIIEAPKPIFQHKPTIFRVPQPIIQIPKPIIEHTPVYYRVPHKVQYPNHQFQAQPYIANPRPYPSQGYAGLTFAAPKIETNFGKQIETNFGKQIETNFGKQIETNFGKQLLNGGHFAPQHGKNGGATFSWSLNYPPASGKTIVKHFSIGHN